MNKKLNSSNRSLPILLTPGPVIAPDSVLGKLSEQTIHHRTQEFVHLFRKTQTLLQKTFQTFQPVLILNSTGTGAMSASLLNTLSPQDTVLILCAGKFGKRWVEMAKAYDLKTIVLEVEWGRSISVKEVEKKLREYPEIKAILSQACETSTGALQPMKEVGALVKNDDSRIFILDAISALGAVFIPMDTWGIDVLIGGSQKFFSLPAGMSFIALSEKAWVFNKTSRFPVYYFDLRKEKSAQAKGQTAFSSNVSFIKALHEFLLPVEKYGLNYFTQKINDLSQMTLSFCKEIGLDIFPQIHSPSVTAIRLPSHIDGVKLKTDIEKKYNITLGGGQGKLKGKIIRIGHLGNVSSTDTLKGLEALALCLHLEDSKLFSLKKIKKTINIFQRNIT